MLATTRIALEEGEDAGKFELDGKGEWLSMDFFRKYLLENNVEEYFEHRDTSTLGQVFGISGARTGPAFVAAIRKHATREKLFADYHDCAANIMALYDQLKFVVHNELPYIWMEDLGFRPSASVVEYVIFKDVRPILATENYKLHIPS